MPRRIGLGLAFGLAAAALWWRAWPGAASNPATLISRVDVLATIVITGGMLWPARRVLGRARTGWLAVSMRLGGYAAVFALVLVKSDVQRHQLAGGSQRPVLGGLWLGEVVFLVVLAGYVGMLLAITSRRPLASPAAVAIGTGTGLGLGLTIYLMRPLANPVHTSSAWLTVLLVVARVLAIALVFGAGIAAGLIAARRISQRDSRLPLADVRARQGVAAGVCVGMTAALIVSVLGILTIALAPHLASHLDWTLPTSRKLQGDGVYTFEVGVSDAAAGFLLVLIGFPVLGAGLGAWGGLYGAGRPGNKPGGNGGGGGWEPQPETPRPVGGLRRGLEPEPVTVDIRQLLDSPAWEGGLEVPQRQSAEPDRRELTPV